MDIKAYTGRWLSFLKKYRYVVLIFVIGLILMMIPVTNQDDTVQEMPQIETEDISLEEKLTAILCRIDGAGSVAVLLTVAQGEEIIYQTNNDISTSNGTNSSRYDTVTITDESRNETGLIQKINPPIYQGAVVVCQGAANPEVRLAIVDAVSKLTGLGANQISVLKMK